MKFLFFDNLLQELVSFLFGCSPGQIVLQALRRFHGFVAENFLRNGAIEELDERSKAEGADQGADADQAAQQEGDDRTECIGKDAAAEVRLVQVVLQGQSQRIVRCNAQVGRLVQRATKRCDRHGNHDPQQLDGQLFGRAEPARNDVVEKSDDEPTAQAVD